MKNTTRSLFRIPHFAFRIICAVLALLCACGGKGRGGDVSGNVSPALADIDSMMWRQPDSAFVMLQAFASSPSADSLGEFDGHYLHLLLSELLYKNDYAQTNRGELLRAADYFDSLYANRGSASLAFLDARSHYIKGVGYYERDSVVEACGEYFKALETMEDRFGENDLKGKKAQFMALTYTHLCALFSDQYLHEQAIFFGKGALPYYSRHHSSKYAIAWILDEIGANYDMTSKYDSAECYYRAALDRLDDTLSLLYRDIVGHLSFLEFSKNRISDSALSILYRRIEQAESEREHLAGCLGIGGIHFQEHNYDSAEAYLNLVFENSDRVLSKRQAAEWLATICLAKGDTMKAKDYSFAVSKMVKDVGVNETLHSELTSLCNRHANKQAENAHKQSKRKLLLWMSLMPLALCIALALLLKQRIHETKMVEKERYAHKMNQKALSGKLKKANERLKKQNQELQQLESRLLQVTEKRPYKGNRDELLAEAVCQDIIKRFSEIVIKRNVPNTCYNNLTLDLHQLAELETAVEKHYTGFKGYLSFLYPKITSRDLEICRLLLLGLNKKEISLALDCDYSTVTNHVNKMEKHFRAENKLSVFIANP